MAENRTPSHTETTFLIPVFDDWQVLEILVRKLDATLPDSCLPATLLIVDDGSNTSPGPGLEASRHERISALEIVRLRRNLGHQRAIAIGLAYVYEEISTRHVVVMDADGEDRPEDVPRLLARLAANGDAAIVFAERRRRFEPAWFKVSYQLYRLAHRLLTGIPVRVGNFSAIPFQLLSRLVVVSELWSHYAAAVFKSRIPYEALPTRRGTRLFGSSKMSYAGLLTHGLAAISVFGEIVGTRVLIFSFVVMGLLGALLLVLLASSSFVGVSPPGWAVALTTLILIVMSQIFIITAGSLFFILYARNQYHFIPLRDYKHFLDKTEA